MAEDGDPRTLAPDLLASFPRYVQFGVVGSFVNRSQWQGRSDAHPIDEPPASVAKHCFLRGIFLIYLVIAGPFLVVGACFLSFVLGEEARTSDWIVLAIMCSITMTFVARASFDAFKVKRFFATHDPRTAA